MTACLSVSFQYDTASLFPQKCLSDWERKVTMRATWMKLQPGPLSFRYRERGIDLRANYALLTSFSELVHVNFSIIVGKILELCLFCTVVQLANFSTNNVIDTLAADVVITRAQTINRAWNFEGLVNMVLKSSAIDWLKAFTRVGIHNTGTRSLVE